MAKGFWKKIKDAFKKDTLESEQEQLKVEPKEINDAEDSAAILIEDEILADADQVEKIAQTIEINDTEDSAAVLIEDEMLADTDNLPSVEEKNSEAPPSNNVAESKKDADILTEISTDEIAVKPHAEDNLSPNPPFKVSAKQLAEGSFVAPIEKSQNTEIESSKTAEKAEREATEKAAREATDLQPETQQKPKSEGGYFARIKQGLAKTRSGFANLFLGKKALDQDLIDDLEVQLLTADVGMEVTTQIIDQVTAKIGRKELKDVEAVKSAVRDHMLNLLAPFAKSLDSSVDKPFVILMTGINGAGKTTTIGKLARHFQAEGKKVMFAAGDTFRAAAVEQLQTWGQRNNVPVIAQGQGADAASVAYDALQSATARGVDVLIIDTAGRLHTQDHLMEELKKIKRVIGKINPKAPHETMLIIDAGNGQNALRQAEHFHKAMELDSITVTKLDGTAKGGIVFAITEKLGVPIRYIGVGEQAEDLRPFNAEEFVNALLYND